MEIIRITPHMIDQDASPVLERIIADAPDDATLSFEKGVYPLSVTVNVKGKKGLTLEGNGATLAPYFNRETGADDGAGVFELLDCEGLTIRGFNIASSVPVNTAGVIVNVTDDYADVELNSTIPLTGKEQFISGMIFEDDWFPTGYHWVTTDPDPEIRTVIAGEIPCTAPKKLNCPHEMLDEKTVRVYSKSVKWLKAGSKCNVSHSYYGLVAFVFRQCESVLIEDVKMTNYAGFAFLLLPCCRDFTFRRVKFESENRDVQPYAINSDGIHLTGLAGKLVLEDCDFNCIGDDKLNVHTQVMTVTSVGEDSLTLVYDKINGVVSPYWSEKSDLLRVYDPETLELKGKVAVARADRGDIILEKSDVNINVGDYITNDKYYPDVIIRRCTFARNRGRALCLQGSDGMLIEDCKFNNSSSCAIYLSSAFDYWLEAGPLANVTIRNNVFCDCRTKVKKDNRSTIHVQINGEKYRTVPPVHKNIRIENNRFENINGLAVLVQMTDGVVVRDNEFIGCHNDGKSVHIERCANVVCENNIEK